MHKTDWARLRATAAATVCAAALLHPAPVRAGSCTGCAKASFDAPPSFGSDQVAVGFAVADFDGDGRLDVVVPTHSSYDAARIFYGDGRGAFGAIPTVVGPNTFLYCSQTLAADLNGDGLPDVLAWNGSVHAFLSDGLGGFVPVGPPEGMPAGTLLVATADFDGDGHPDLVTTDVSAQELLLFHGNGDGTFGAPEGYPAGPEPGRFVVADFNADGHPDVAVADFNANVITVFLGDGNGRLSQVGTFDNIGLVMSMAAGDLNGDGHVDLAVGGSGQGSDGFLSIFSGDGTGHFVAGPVFAGVDQLIAVRIADLDGDGKLDLLTQSNGFAGLTTYRNLGGGSFGPAASYDFPGLLPEIGDFDGDGHPDVALAGRGAFVVHNDGTGGLVVASASPLGDYPGDAMLTHLDGDAFADLVTAVPFSVPAISSYLGNGDGTFGPPHTVMVIGPPSSPVTADFTGDGKPDVAVALGGGGLAVLAGDGAGGLGAPVTVDVGATVNQLAVADFDENGKPDLIASGSGTFLLLNDGQGGFLPPRPIDQYGGFPRTAYVDGDGHLDLIIGTSSFEVFLGDGQGHFTGPIYSNPGPGSGRFVVGDFDEDGKADLVGSDIYGLFWMKGDGTGSFADPVYSPQQGGYWLDAADFNADGHLDVAMNGDTAVRIALGDGHGSFAPATEWATAAGSLAIMAVGDVDADGRPDVVAGDRNVYGLRNTNCRPVRLGVSVEVASCALPDQVFPQQPVVGVYDDGGNVVPCDTGLVTASIVPGTGTPGALLGGTASRNAVAGVAAFTDLSIDVAGSGYVIEMAHAGLRPTRARPLRVGDPPASPAASNSGPFCQGQDVALYATSVPGAVYRWTGPDGFSSTIQSPVIPAATLDDAGDYSVVAVVDGCESAAAITTLVALAPAPGPPIRGEQQVCFGSRLLLHADDGALRHQWYKNGAPIDGAAGAVYTVAQAGYADAGDYTVTASDATGCTTAASPSHPVAIVFCYADAEGIAVDPSGNGVLDPGESAVIVPTWKDRDVQPLSLSGTAAAFVGPGGAASYSIDDATAGYGTIAPNASADCLTATGDCYAVSVSGTRPATHWDAFLDEMPGIDPAHTWVLHVGGSFPDVPVSHPFYAAIEKVLHNRVTAGCVGGNYCPASGVTRAQMAVFILKGRYGADFVPQPCHGTFADVPCPSPFADWIEEFAALGITAGCGGGNYCPNDIVNRAQMAVFLLKTPGSGAPPCKGVFADVPCPGGFAVDWIELLYNTGITAGCGANPLTYCPTSPNTRGQMAVFLTRAFSLVLYSP